MTSLHHIFERRGIYKLDYPKTGTKSFLLFKFSTELYPDHRLDSFLADGHYILSGLTENTRS